MKNVRAYPRLRGSFSNYVYIYILEKKKKTTLKNNLNDWSQSKWRPATLLLLLCTINVTNEKLNF